MGSRKSGAGARRKASPEDCSATPATALESNTAAPASAVKMEVGCFGGTPGFSKTRRTGREHRRWSARRVGNLSWLRTPKRFRDSSCSIGRGEALALRGLPALSGPARGNRERGRVHGHLVGIVTPQSGGIRCTPNAFATADANAVANAKGVLGVRSGYAAQLTSLLRPKGQGPACGTGSGEALGLRGMPALSGARSCVAA